MLRVDGKFYVWMGEPGNNIVAVQKNITVRTTRSPIVVWYRDG